MCTDSTFYSLGKPEGKDHRLIPSDKRVNLGSYMSFVIGNITYSCYPFLSFEPESGETYLVHNYVRARSCFIEVVREDGSTETGLAVEPSAGKRDCFVNKTEPAQDT